MLWLAMHDMVGHNQQHGQALCLQWLDNLAVFPDVLDSSTFPLPCQVGLPSLDGIHLCGAFPALQMCCGPSDGGGKISALVVSTGGVWM